MKVLIIEQEKTLLQSLRNYLEDGKKFDVFWAHSGGEGLSLWNKGGFDAVLCGERLPDGSGLDILQALVRQKPGIISILMTARHDELLMEEAARGGIQAYLEKPFDLKQLEEALGESRP